MWKSMKSWVRNRCQKWPCIVFGVTFQENKQCNGHKWLLLFTCTNLWPSRFAAGKKHTWHVHATGVQIQTLPHWRWHAATSDRDLRSDGAGLNVPKGALSLLLVEPEAVVTVHHVRLGLFGSGGDSWASCGGSWSCQRDPGVVQLLLIHLEAPVVSGASSSGTPNLFFSVPGTTAHKQPKLLPDSVNAIRDAAYFLSQTISCN